MRQRGGPKDFHAIARGALEKPGELAQMPNRPRADSYHRLSAGTRKSEEHGLQHELPKLPVIRKFYLGLKSFRHLSE